MVGHIDRKGLRDDDASKSWNSSHPSRGPGGGCSQSDLRGTGGREGAAPSPAPPPRHCTPMTKRLLRTYHTVANRF
jgi:hypothetical protein